MAVSSLTRRVRYSASTNVTVSTPVKVAAMIMGREAVLSTTPSGSILVRVVDTDRTAGHQDLDSVSVDELFVRSVP